MEMLSWKDKKEALETWSKKPEGNLEIERVKVQERNKDIMLIDSQIDELRDRREQLVKENKESTLKIIGKTKLMKMKKLSANVIANSMNWQLHLLNYQVRDAMKSFWMISF
ncbi:hypothetical protein Hanom_Chr05g00475381 [Helianthus anomalus]